MSVAYQKTCPIWIYKSFRPKSATRQSQSPAKKSYQKSSSGQSNHKGSHQRKTSKHGRRYSRSPGGKSWFISSRSATPSSNYNQDNRGRSGNPNAYNNNCMRCGKNHMSSECRLYTFYSGDPCGKCGLMHATHAHRTRSTSANRATAPRISGYESILVPTAQSLNPVNFLERNEQTKN